MLAQICWYSLQITPHPEGTGNPIAKFERTMENCDQATMDKFYHGNMLEVMSVA